MDLDWKKMWGGFIFYVFILFLRWLSDEPMLSTMQASLIVIFGAVVTRPSQKTMWQTFKDWRSKIVEDESKKHLPK
jgi:hypothetical protein